MRLVPNQPKTPTRTVRIDDELWQAAQSAAARNHESITDVIRKALRDYVSRTNSRGTARAPDRGGISR
jgi:predicted transcriptional regulator